MFSLHMLLQQQDGLLPLLQPHFQVVDLLLLLLQLLLEAIIALLQRLAERLRRTVKAHHRGGGEQLSSGRRTVGCEKSCRPSSSRSSVSQTGGSSCQRSSRFLVALKVNGLIPSLITAHKGLDGSQAEVQLLLLLSDFVCCVTGSIRNLRHRSLGHKIINGCWPLNSMRFGAAAMTKKSLKVV